MKWAVEIQKTSLTLRNLRDLLRPLGFDVVSEDKCPELTSPSLDACASASKVFDVAKLVRAAFTGPSKIDPQFALGDVLDYSCNPPKRQHFLETEPAIAGSIVSPVNLIQHPPRGLSPAEEAAWEVQQAERAYQSRLKKQKSKLVPAFFNQDAVKVLQLLSEKRLTGENAYKLYELLEGPPTNRPAFHLRFGIVKDEFDRFRDAVHNPKVTGDWARHAYESEPRTRSPMTPEEAEAFVRNLAERWLEFMQLSHDDVSRDLGP